MIRNQDWELYASGPSVANSPAAASTDSSPNPFRASRAAVRGDAPRLATIAAARSASGGSAPTASPPAPAKRRRRQQRPDRLVAEAAVGERRGALRPRTVRRRRSRRARGLRAHRPDDRPPRRRGRAARRSAGATGRGAGARRAARSIGSDALAVASSSSGTGVTSARALLVGQQPRRDHLPGRRLRLDRAQDPLHHVGMLLQERRRVLAALTEALVAEREVGTGLLDGLLLDPRCRAPCPPTRCRRRR